MDRKKAEGQKPRKLKKAQKNVAPMSDITVEATLLAKIDGILHLR